MQSIGFYGPDPGGHQPFQILEDNGSVLRVRQLTDGIVLDVEKADLMDFTGLKTRIHEVMNGERYRAHGEMAEMLEPLLKGYLSTLMMATEEAFSKASQPENKYSHDFKNFHRLLCERFGYVHDEKFWWRDQLSLIEFITSKIPTEHEVIEK